MTSVFSWVTSMSLCLVLSVLQGQICLLLQVSLDSYFCIPVPYNEKDIFFWMVVLEGVVGLIEPVNMALVDRALTWITVTLNGLPWE